jgi:tripartite-type tricarboxylate transporter receptor subunit TctC
MQTMIRFAGTALALAATLAPALVCAQPAYPNRAIRVIMPFAPSGSADNLGRLLQPALAEALGQQIVIDNRPGGSSIIGTDLAAKSAPDGYTILMVTTTHTVAPSLIAKLPFDPIKDFAGVSLVVTQPNILAVHPSVPVKSVKELVALAKAKPDTLNYASGGNGSSPHLSGELLKYITGVKIQHVPYKGSGPGVADLVAGQVQMMFAGPLAFEQYIRTDRLRALAVADKRRSGLLPEVPTMTEAGFPGIETGTWYALLVPARTPRPVITRLHEAIVKIMQQPEMKTRMAGQGVDIVVSTPQQTDQILVDETAKWAKLVKAAKIKVE